MSNIGNESDYALKQKTIYFSQQLLDNIANIDLFLTNLIHWTEVFPSLAPEARHRLVRDLLDKLHAIKEHTDLMLAQEWPTAHVQPSYPY